MDHPVPESQPHPCPRCRLHGAQCPAHFCEVKKCSCNDCQQMQISQYPTFVMQNERMVCSRCSVHGIGSGFQHSCPFQECNCDKCSERFSQTAVVGSENGIAAAKRRPKCAFCRNHDIETLIEEPRWICAFWNCTCPKCERTRERQRRMAEQLLLWVAKEEERNRRIEGQI